MQFFHIATSKSGPNMQCFVHFDFKMCFSLQRRANQVGRPCSGQSAYMPFCATRLIDTWLPRHFKGIDLHQWSCERPEEPLPRLPGDSITTCSQFWALIDSGNPVARNKASNHSNGSKAPKYQSHEGRIELIFSVAICLTFSIATRTKCWT